MWTLRLGEAKQFAKLRQEGWQGITKRSSGSERHGRGSWSHPALLLWVAASFPFLVLHVLTCEWGGAHTCLPERL